MRYIKVEVTREQHSFVYVAVEDPTGVLGEQLGDLAGGRAKIVAAAEEAAGGLPAEHWDDGDIEIDGWQEVDDSEGYEEVSVSLEGCPPLQAEGQMEMDLG